MNCGSPTKGRYNYKGGILCSHCHSLAQMCDKRAVTQVRQILTVYRESLRVSLASGRLRPNTRIPKGEKATPATRNDIVKLMDKLVDIRRTKGGS